MRETCEPDAAGSLVIYARPYNAGMSEQDEALFVSGHDLSSQHARRNLNTGQEVRIPGHANWQASRHGSSAHADALIMMTLVAYGYLKTQECRYTRRHCAYEHYRIPERSNTPLLLRAILSTEATGCSHEQNLLRSYC